MTSILQHPLIQQLLHSTHLMFYQERNAILCIPPGKTLSASLLDTYILIPHPKLHKYISLAGIYYEKKGTLLVSLGKTNVDYPSLVQEQVWERTLEPLEGIQTHVLEALTKQVNGIELRLWLLEEPLLPPIMLPRLEGVQDSKTLLFLDAIKDPRLAHLIPHILQFLQDLQNDTFPTVAHVDRFTTISESLERFMSHIYTLLMTHHYLLNLGQGYILDFLSGCESFVLTHGAQT